MIRRYLDPILLIYVGQFVCVAHALVSSGLTWTAILI